MSNQTGNTQFRTGWGGVLILQVYDEFKSEKFDGTPQYVKGWRDATVADLTNSGIDKMVIDVGSKFPLRFRTGWFGVLVLQICCERGEHGTLWRDATVADLLVFGDSNESGIGTE